MDILVLILLLALYVLPEVLRRARKPKNYEYPQFPPADQPGESAAKPPARIPSHWSPALPTPSPVKTVAKEQTPPVNQSLPVEQPVEFNHLAYGLVMAEILGPPRSRNRLGSRR